MERTRQLYLGGPYADGVRRRALRSPRTFERDRSSVTAILGTDSQVFDLAILGGDVVSETEIIPADIYVREGRVAGLTERGLRLPAKVTSDATGLHVLPGVLDVHAHFRWFSPHSDTFAQMSRSAAFGGVTTVIGHLMGMNTSSLRPRDRVERMLGEAEGNATTDYSFHLGLADEDHALSDIERIVSMGITSFKMFMAYRSRKIMVDDLFMLQALRRLRAEGALPLIHAELGDAADELEAEIRGHERNPGPAALARSRPPWIEAEAVRRALTLARAAGSDCYFVHLSTADSVNHVVEARSQGQVAFAETCPQYLNLTTEDFVRAGNVAKIAPPLRSEEHRNGLLQAVKGGRVNVVGSDHSPHTVADKQGGDLWAVPWGAPGTETLLPMTWRALQSVGLDLTAVARLLAAEPARIFGLYPRKGTIAVGSDADFTIVDTSATTTIASSQQHSSAGYSLYDRIKCPMRLTGTFLRGRPLLVNGELRDDRDGRFLARSPRQVSSTSPRAG